MKKSPRVLIRAARSADLPELVELLCQLFAIETDFTIDRARHRRGLRLLLAAARSGRSRVFVAEGAGNVVGMATVQVVVSTARGALSGWIEDVIVREDQRGKGVGRALTRAIELWARGRHIARLQLLADRRNRPALVFYAKGRFERTNMICLRRSVASG